MTSSKSVFSTFAGRLLLGLFFFLALSFAPAQPRASDASSLALAEQEYLQEQSKCTESLKKNQKASTTYKLASVSKFFSDAFDNIKQTNPQDVMGNIMKSHCLDAITDPNGFFAMLNRLFSGSFWEGLMQAMIDGLINYLINRVCTWMQQALNNLLNSICIPLPTLAFDLNWDLPSIEARQCGSNTLSLGDVVAFRSNYPTKYFPTSFNEFKSYARGRASSGRPYF